MLCGHFSWEQQIDERSDLWSSRQVPIFSVFHIADIFHVHSGWYYNKCGKLMEKKTGYERIRHECQLTLRWTMNYQEILSHFTYDDSTDIRNRAAVAEAGDYRENRDIINEIVLWKMNRRPQVTEELIDAIFSLKEIKTPLQALEDEKTAQVIEKLLQTKGMQLPMASTVLHFYYPEVFPIIDQRAYRELYAMDYPKTMTKIPMLTELYLKYIKDCWEYQQEKCFSDR